MDNLIELTFKIRFVNVQKVIEVPGSRFKSLHNVGLIFMVKRIHETFRNSIKINQLYERGVPIGTPTIRQYSLVLNLI